MHVVAHFGLLAALLLSVFGAAASALTAWEGRGDRLVWIERGQAALTLVLVLASAILLRAFVARDFSLLYVAEYSDRFLPMFYTVTAFWAGQSGSLLFWTLTVALFGLLFSWTKAYAALSADTRHLFWAFFLVVEAFFLALLTGPSNPFTAISPTPPDGRGLNPLLRNPGMIFHPPLLFLGYAGFTVPGCLGLAAWLSGRGDAWLSASRNVTVISWIFLTAGIILGGWWSYMELGWGGYWAWDPVENASLIPWLVGTAFVHTAVVQARKGALAKTNVALASATLLSCFFATYLVRSGVVDSLHAFGEGGVGTPLLLFLLAGLVLTALALSAGRGFTKGGQKPLSGLFSLPGFLVILAWLLLALSLVIMLGTLWPVVSKLWSANPVGLDAGFYNRVCTPLFALIGLMLVFCPWLSWGDGLRDRASALFLAALFLAAGVGLYVVGIRQPVALLAAAAAVAALCGIAWLLVREKAARSRRGALGAWLTHLGLVLVIGGVAISGPYETSKEAILSPGRTLTIGDFTLTYKDLNITETQALATAQAVLDVTRNGQPHGELTPERRIYRNYEQPFAEVSTIFSLTDEVYATLLSFTEQKSISLKVSVHPLVNWVWIGGTLMCLAAFLALRGFRAGSRGGESGGA